MLIQMISSSFQDVNSRYKQNSIGTKNTVHWIATHTPYLYKKHAYHTHIVYAYLFATLHFTQAIGQSAASQGNISARNTGLAYHNRQYSDTDNVKWKKKIIIKESKTDDKETQHENEPKTKQNIKNKDWLTLCESMYLLNTHKTVIFARLLIPLTVSHEFRLKLQGYNLLLSICSLWEKKIAPSHTNNKLQSIHWTYE